VYFYKHGNHVALFYRSQLKRTEKCKTRYKEGRGGRIRGFEVNLR